MAKIIDLAGKRFGRWTVLELASTNPVRWRCLCDCGIEKDVLTRSLNAGESKSCGCFSVDTARATHTKHGHTLHGDKSGAYSSWDAMIQRCHNPAAFAYDYYGGRGILVCERWRKFDGFYADMQDRPEGKELDRWPDKNGNYEPGNVRWRQGVSKCEIPMPTA